VIADGIIGPGLSIERALGYLNADSLTKPDEALLEVYNGYGCNMAIRVSAAKAGNVEFDENLPLYGWLEDVDFSRRLGLRGRIVRATLTRGVHMGVKSGRQSGIRLGYSQIANPVYLVRKRTLTCPRAVSQMARNVIMNLIFSLRPEPYVDRRGRLHGNLTAIRDLLLGRLNPERIMSM
jgi:GT2 family glycosyltransferase